MIEIWTDGSSLRNGKPDCVGGWAFVTFINRRKVVRYGHLTSPSSNNRGEIAGVLYGLARFHSFAKETLYYSDSQYVRDSILTWRHKHKKTAYRGIKNMDMLGPLYDLWDHNGKASIQWVKGHADNPGNLIADEYAGYGSRNTIIQIKDETQDIAFVSEEELTCLVKSSMKAILTR